MCPLCVLNPITMRMFLMLAAMIGLFAGCATDDDASAQADITFRAYFGNEPLLMYERAYPYEEGMSIRLQRFNFYVSEVVLLPEDPAAEPVELAEVELVDYSDVQDPEAAQRGIVIRGEGIPPGRYRGIRFGLGLTEALNNSQPGDYQPGHPLTDNYWSWAMGYVFFKVEGNADLNGDGEFTEKLTFHIGGAPYYQQLDFPVLLDAASGQELDLDFAVDLKRVLSDGQGHFLDFRKVSQDHTNDPAVGSFLADNFRAAIRRAEN